MAMKFKTNINCGGCIAAVTPVLDAAVGAGKWRVETDNPDKVLHVEETTLSAEEIGRRLGAIGYKASPL